MNSLKITQLTSSDIEEVNKFFQNLKTNQLHKICNTWSNFDLNGTYNFSVGYTESELFLYYRIEETQTTAYHSEINSEVWQDSCVEFFLQINDNEYQNFEFNCCGVALSATGASRDNRTHLSTEELKQIKTVSTLHKREIPFKKNNSKWELTIQIPYDIIKSDFNFCTKPAIKGNFYKCCENSDYPHFATWAPINTDKPDFHRPEFFEKILLK